MWWTALIMGFAGSLHCAGMCSPLAMAITTQRPFLINKLIYNLGRVFTYGLLGALAASVGSIFLITPYQTFISFGIGIFFLLMGVGAIAGVHIPFLTKAINRFNNWLKELFGYWLKKKNYIGIAMMGMLNGLLPCGLTYLALTYCFIMPTRIEGFGFMILFGLGTWPVMIGFTWLLSRGFSRVKLNYQKITTIIFIFIGVWLLTRAVLLQPLTAHEHLFGVTHTNDILCR